MTTVLAAVVGGLLGGVAGAVVTVYVARRSRRAGMTAFLDLEIGGNDDERTAKPRRADDPGHD